MADTPNTLKPAKVCADTPLPDLSVLMKKLQAIHLPSIPDFSKFLPTLPSPMLPNLKMPSFELANVALALQQFQMMSLFKALIKPLMDWSGFKIKIPALPTIPSISFAKLLAGPINLSAFKIPKSLIPDFNINFSCPITEKFTKFQILVGKYISIIAETLAAVIQKVIDKANPKPFKLGLPGLPTLPKMPSIPNLIAMMKVPSLPGLSVPNFSFPTFKFPSLPGLPPMPKLPSPLFPGFKNPELEFAFSLAALTTFISKMILDPILKWCLEFGRKVASFSLPKICIPV